MKEITIQMEYSPWPWRLKMDENLNWLLKVRGSARWHKIESCWLHDNYYPEMKTGGTFWDGPGRIRSMMYSDRIMLRFTVENHARDWRMTMQETSEEMAAWQSARNQSVRWRQRTLDGVAERRPYLHWSEAF